MPTLTQIHTRTLATTYTRVEPSLSHFCVHAHTHIHTPAPARTHARTHALTHVEIFECISVQHTRIPLYIYVCACVSVSVCTWAAGIFGYRHDI